MQEWIKGDRPTVGMRSYHKSIAPKLSTCSKKQNQQALNSHLRMCENLLCELKWLAQAKHSCDMPWRRLSNSPHAYFSFCLITKWKADRFVLLLYLKKKKSKDWREVAMGKVSFQAVSENREDLCVQTWQYVSISLAFYTPSAATSP